MRIIFEKIPQKVQKSQKVHFKCWWGCRETITFFVGLWTSTATLEILFTVASKVKNTPAI